jgi:hypothetical protein
MENLFLGLIFAEILVAAAFVTSRKTKNEKRWIPDIRRVA